MTFDLPRPFLMEGIQRVDETPQHKAVREAFTNAIIHADIMMDAGILRVEKHDDKLCFRNPGLLRLPIGQIYKGESSRARNPRIQNMLRMIGYGENIGSGFPTILAAWKNVGWGNPELKNKVELDEVELVLPIPRVERAAFPTINVGKDVGKEISKRQRKIVEMMITDPSLSAKTITERISEKESVNERTIERDIAKLKKMGFLSREGGRKDGRWVVRNKEASAK